MDGPTTVPSQSKARPAKKKEDFPFDEFHFHLYRSLWIVIQDVDAVKADCDRDDYKYKSWRTQVPALESLCTRYTLRRTRTDQKSLLENFSGTTLGYALKRTWHSLAKVTAGAKHEQKYFWRDGSSCCDPERLKQLEIAYRTLSEEQSQLPTYEGEACIPSSSDRDNDLQVSTRLMALAKPHSEPTVLSAIAGDSVRSATSSDDDMPLLRRMKRHRTTVHIPSSTVSPRKSPIVKDEPPSSSSRHETQTSNYASVQSQGGALDLVVASPRRLVVEEVTDELGAIFRKQMNAIKILIELQLRLHDNHCSVTPAPSHLLAVLYTRCWGKKWSETCDQLLEGDMRSAVTDTMALISAFIYESVLIQDLPLASHVVDATALGLEYLSTQAHNLTSQLMLILDPYLSALVNWSRMMYRAPLATDGHMESTFRSSLNEIIASVLRLKHRIDSSEMQPVYVWPVPRAAYDPSKMQAHQSIDRSSSSQHTVGYTIFPGVCLAHADCSESSPDVAYHARVVLQKS